MTSCIGAHVFEGRKLGDHLQWDESAKSVPLDDLCQKIRSSKGVTIGFVPNGEDMPRETVATTRTRLSSTFEIPDLFWTEMCDKASGFFGARGSSSAGGKYTFMMRFEIKQPTSSYVNPHKAYRWDKTTIYASQDSNGITMLFVGLRPELRHRMCRAISKVIANPDWIQLLFFVQAGILMELVSDFDTSVWNWRHQVRDLEEHRIVGQPLPDDFFELMHEISRHVIHCSESLVTGIGVVNSCRQEISSFAGTEAVLQELDLCLSLLTCFSNRSQALEKRLQNEINLAFHNNSQHNSIVNQHISEMAQQDGRVSRGISVLGMVFLPGTFVSAIFSMTFFSTERLIVSDQFWIYWVVTIPLTALTLATWYFWQQVSDGRKKKLGI